MRARRLPEPHAGQGIRFASGYNIPLCPFQIPMHAPMSLARKALPQPLHAIIGILPSRSMRTLSEPHVPHGKVGIIPLPP